MKKLVLCFLSFVLLASNALAVPFLGNKFRGKLSDKMKVEIKYPDGFSPDLKCDSSDKVVGCLRIRNNQDFLWNLRKYNLLEANVSLMKCENDFDYADMSQNDQKTTIIDQDISYTFFGFDESDMGGKTYEYRYWVINEIKPCVMVKYTFRFSDKNGFVDYHEDLDLSPSQVKTEDENFIKTKKEIYETFDAIRRSIIIRNSK